jgi:putative MATE family efflux protein
MESSPVSVSSVLRSRDALIEFFRDAEYYRRLVQVGLPITLQQFVMSSLNMVSVMIIGQLGETAIAAVGLANQIGFLCNLLLFGITSGSAIFTAQLWGKGDIPNIRKVLGLCIMLGLAGGGFFWIVSLFFPTQAVGIYSSDMAVVNLGGQYLRIFGWAFLFMPVTFSFAAVLRSTGDVRTPLVVSLVALSLNTLLSYGLIFGRFGLPELGVQGAAVAGLLARVMECGGLLLLVYRRRGPAAARLAELFRYDSKFMKKILQRVLPVALNELLWALGIAAYNVVYARIGTDSIAAMNIASSIDNMAFVIFLGLGNGCAILVGNRIGAGEDNLAFRYAGRSLGLGIVGGLLVGGLILAGSPLVLDVYKVSPEVIEYTRKILLIIALFLWLRVSNLILFIGVFRSGGDTRFGFFLDAGTIWVVGVPLAVLAAFVFHLPVYLVYLMVMIDELTKFIVGLWRYLSRRWIHNLAGMVEGEGASIS